jgi:hypothetical protein
MSFQKNVDQKIEEAIARGEFDNLPGKGKPLDLDAYFATPEHLRMGYSILKSADILPEEMELLKQIEGLKKSLDSNQAMRLTATPSPAPHVYQVRPRKDKRGVDLFRFLNAE